MLQQTVAPGVSREASYKTLCSLEIDIQKSLLIKLKFLGSFVVHLPDDRHRKVAVEFCV
jgi:hypothetical protein